MNKYKKEKLELLENNIVYSKIKDMLPKETIKEIEAEMVNKKSNFHKMMVNSPKAEAEMRRRKK